MANFHIRSNSLPSKSHPLMDEVENLVRRLKSSEAASTSSDSLCSSLARLRNLHENINTLIQLPSVQQALSLEQGENWINELLEASIGLVDLCGFSRDVIYSIKESVQELESSIRRNRGNSSNSDEIKAYVSSRKKIIKKMNNYSIKNLKSFKKGSLSLPDKDDSDLKAIAKMLKETEAFDFDVLKSVLLLLSGEKETSNQRNQSLFSKFSRVHSQETGPEESTAFLNIHKTKKSMDNINILKQLQSSDMILDEIEDGLEALFKSLVKTRVSLLNLLSH